MHLLGKQQVENCSEKYWNWSVCKVGDKVFCTSAVLPSCSIAALHGKRKEQPCLVIFCSLARFSHTNANFPLFLLLLMDIFPLDKPKIIYSQLAMINTDSILLSLYLEYPARQSMGKYDQNYIFGEFYVLFWAFWVPHFYCAFLYVSGCTLLYAVSWYYIVTLQLPQKLPWYIQVNFVLLLVSIISHICCSGLWSTKLLRHH